MRARVVRLGPLAIAVAVIAWWSVSAVRAKTGGEPSLPLDDAFIHLQYARAFATGHPLHYVPGDPATSGATSLLWSAVLAPFWAVGARGLNLVWVAWGLSFAALAGLAWETRRLAARLLPRGSAVLAGAFALSFGGHVWCAGSGMEVIPFAWLLVRAARLCAEVWENETGGEPLPPLKSWDGLIDGAIDPPTAVSTTRLATELALFGACLPLLRPEGALVAVFAAFVLRLRRQRPWLVPLFGVLLPPLIFRFATGHATASTTQVKWLLASPYVDWPKFWSQTLQNVYVLFGQLLDGKGPAKLFVPEHFSVLFLLAPFALAFAVKQRGHAFRALCIAVVAVGILLPTTYDTFMVNRLRYLWPFTAAWGIGLMAIGDVAATLAARFDPKLKALRAIIGGVIVLAFAGELPEVIDDLAVSSAAIHDQQIAAAREAEKVLPPDALVAVNDAGAMAYLSGRKTFDIVGLTTRDEARYWVQGAGSRFEHYERLAREGKRLPTHLLVYPGWFEISPVLGNKLFERTVDGAIDLGGPTLVAHEASWSLLGTGELPMQAEGSVIDALDVADLESESEHGYELGDARRQDDGLVMNEKRIDGGRLNRSVDRFQLRLSPSSRLVMRVGTTLPFASLLVRIDGNDTKRLDLAGDPWQEPVVEVPAFVAEGSHRIEISAPAGHRFVALHYWSLR